MKRRDFIGTAAGAAALAAFTGGGTAADARPDAAAAAAQAQGRSRESTTSGPALPPKPVWKEPAVELRFQGDLTDLQAGIEILSADLNFRVSPRGLRVKVTPLPKNLLRISKKGNRAEIQFNQKHHFFRGLGLLLEEMKSRKDFELIEEPQFATIGTMIDVSQGNAVIDVPNVKAIINLMAVMGLNMLMLYAEDSYDVKGEPYFGYMRGRYSQDDIREIDAYAASLGIEAIPCMQTLAHLTDVLQWDAYGDIREDRDTLLVGHEKTYAFIERMLIEAAAPFKTRRIHIGMDEAWLLGQGNYLKLHGQRKKFDIMSEHLNRVLAITGRLGLKPMIWSDMYFRAVSPTGDYYDESAEFKPEDLRAVPANVQFVYWDYYNEDPAFYDKMIKRHKQFGSDPIFAGGIWGWQGYGTSYGKTFVTTNAALEACKQNGIREVFATIWGDATTESNIYSHILGWQLFAEHAYARRLDEEKLKRRFKFCTGCDYNDFWDINGLNAIPGVDKNSPGNASRWLMWQDILLGLFDKNIEGLPLERHYSELARKLEAGAARNGRFNFLFSYMAKVSAVLALKSEMGLKLRKAYLGGDREALKILSARELPELGNRLRSLWNYHRALWMSIHQPAGWEILDLRYGALLARIDTAQKRVNDYLEGRICALRELEEERLPFDGRPGVDDLICNSYDRIVSASRMAYSYKF